jgi:hypothetical protein
MSADDVAAAFNGARAASPGVKALAVARRQLGVAEVPPGSNRTPYGRWFGADGEPWCAIFLSYCFVRGAGIVLCGGVDGPGVAARGCAYVPTLEGWLRDTRQWLEGEPLKPGDIAIFDWDGGEPDHCGLVVRDLGGGSFLTIEGNTENRVARRTRSATDATGFGRVRPLVPASPDETGQGYTRGSG